jgi:hypothetical protein
MNNDSDIGRIQGELRTLSKAVFSKLYRLEIAGAISAQEPPIWSRRLSGTLGLAENQVASEISAFASFGALQRFPSEFDRRKLYQVVPHPIWTFSRTLLEDTIRTSFPEAGDEKIGEYWAVVLDGAEALPLPASP